MNFRVFSKNLKILKKEKKKKMEKLTEIEEKYLALKDNAKKEFLKKAFPEAIKLYQSALEILNKEDQKKFSFETKNQKSILNSNIGFALSKSGKDEEALPFFDESIAQNPKYEKSILRKTQSLFNLNQFTKALTALNKLQELKKDPAAVSLKSKLNIKIQSGMTPIKVFSAFSELFSDANIKRMEVRHKSKDNQEETTKIEIEEIFQKQEQIEWQFISLNKIIENEHNINILLQILFDFHKIFLTKKIENWRKMLTKSNYHKLISIFYVIIEKINHNKLKKFYVENFDLDPKKPSKGSKTFEKLASVYETAWKNFISSEEKFKDIILIFPIFFRNLEILNKISLRLKVNKYKYKDKEEKYCQNIQLFFQVLCTSFKRLAASKDALLKTLESEYMKFSGEILIEFLDRVSRSNSKEAKSFLVVFLKSLTEVYEGKVSELLFGKMAHLYRGSFSFQSILLMNSLLLSDFPVIVDDLSENQPVFIVKNFLIFF